MNQYLDAAIKAARAAGALVRENFGRPLKVNVEEAHDIKLELDVRSQALITDYQGTRRANQYPQGRVRQSPRLAAPNPS
jgi:fructose-1,6-bisphosphatase/inositol monophosphatase family enzyme